MATNAMRGTAYVLPTLLKSIWSHPLNRRFGRFAAIARLIRWQVSQRVRTRTVRLAFVNGSHLLATRGNTGATGNWYSGLDEPAEMGFTLHVLRPGDLLLDVGANLGSYTVLAGAGVGCRVVALEPSSDTYDKLVANVRSNGLDDKVTALKLAASRECGSAALTLGLDACNCIDESGQGERVETTTIDALGLAPTILKVDVEGHESAVLDGATETLASESLLAVILETNGSNQQGQHDQLCARLLRFGFRPSSYNPLVRRFRYWNGERNTIFVRDTAVVSKRFKTAPSYSLVRGSI